MSQQKCPLCLTPLQAVLERNGRGDEVAYQLRVEGAPDRLDILRESLLGYWRWIAEGQTPSRTGESRCQYYYDPYHNHIKYVEAEKVYEFSIQTFDSPDGDTWWSGKFKLTRLMEIELLKDGTSNS